WPSAGSLWRSRRGPASGRLTRRVPPVTSVSANSLSSAATWGGTTDCVDPSSRAARQDQPPPAAAWDAPRPRTAHLAQPHRRCDNLRCVDDGQQRSSSRNWDGEEVLVMVGGIGQVVLEVEDQDRALAFWTGPIGFELVYDGPTAAGSRCGRWTTRHRGLES